jgi:hypothetical protein
MLSLITVFDLERPGTDGKPMCYTGALVDLLVPRNRGRPHVIHGMVEVQDWPKIDLSTSRKLGGRRFYALPTILRSAHVVPAAFKLTIQGLNIFYVNNFIDWDQY